MSEPEWREVEGMDCDDLTVIAKCGCRVNYFRDQVFGDTISGSHCEAHGWATLDGGETLLQTELRRRSPEESPKP